MKYWYHPESDSYGVELDDDVSIEDSGDGLAVELDRDEWLEGIAYQALQNAAQNDAPVPEDDRELAMDMISGGVFALGGEVGELDFTDDYGKPIAELVRAVGRARNLRREQ